MDIRILRYFLTVAQEETITRAAERLHISQPSLSKQLIELEQELGKPLLVRGKRKISLTENGIFLRKRAEEILSLFEKTQQELTSDQLELTGEVSIGGNLAVSVLETAAALRQQHPAIQFHFYSSDATDVTERLEHGSLDFAVLLCPVDPLKHASLQLPEASSWGALFPKEHPLAKQAVITPDIVRELPLLLHRRPGLQHEISRWAHTQPEHLHIAATYNVINGSPIPLVQSGLGILLTTRDLLTPELDSTVCFRPLEPPLTTRYALVWKHHAMHTKPAEKFLQMLRGRLDTHT